MAQKQEITQLTVIAHPYPTSGDMSNEPSSFSPTEECSLYLPSLVEFAKPTRRNQATVVVRLEGGSPQIWEKEEELVRTLLGRAKAPGRVVLIDDIAKRREGWDTAIQQSLSERGLMLSPGVAVTIGGGYLDLSVITVASVVLDALKVPSVTIDPQMTYSSGKEGSLERTRRIYGRMGYPTQDDPNGRYLIMTKSS